VGIELKATLKVRKLLILLNEKNAKNIEFAQPRYTGGTRNATTQGTGEASEAATRLYFLSEITGAFFSRQIRFAMRDATRLALHPPLPVVGFKPQFVKLF